jgi:hypothetical protein
MPLISYLSPAGLMTPLGAFIIAVIVVYAFVCFVRLVFRLYNVR